MHIHIPLVTYGVGLLTGWLLWAAPAPDGERQLSNDATASECPLEDLLGITSTVAHVAVSHFATRLPAEAGAHTPLQSHPSSKSILQDAFVRLHHMLFLHTPPLLPLHEWGARMLLSRPPTNSWLHSAYTIPFNRSWGHARPSVLSRLAINGWLQAQGVRTSQNATCLGWDNTEYVEEMYMPGCTRRWSFKFESRRERWRVDRRRHVIVGDLVQPVPGSEAQFDAIVCNQVR